MSDRSETLVINSLQKLERYVSEYNYRGWDPYDALASKRIPKKLLENNKLFGILLIQINLYSSINLRPFLKIEPGRSNKSLALFSRAYYSLFETFRNYEYLSKGRKLLNELIRRTENACPAYYFEYIAPKHILGPGISDVICLTESIKTLLTAYEVERRKSLLNLARKRIDFIFDSFLVENEDVAYFKYTSMESGKVVFNVSALVLETLAKYIRVSGRTSGFTEVGRKTVRFLIDHQRQDGAWPYSLYLDKNRYYWQIDYHQGFIIDGLMAFLPYLDGELRSEVKDSLERGIKFYIEKQFTKDGYSYYRYPIKYPMDIHNQAQGIITFSKLYRATGEGHYLDFVKRIALWTIQNMQSPEGYFYIHKWPLFTNKIPYMRWGQAWMILALATLLEVLKDENSNDSTY